MDGEIVRRKERKKKGKENLQNRVNIKDKQKSLIKNQCQYVASTTK